MTRLDLNQTWDIPDSHEGVDGKTIEIIEMVDFPAMFDYRISNVVHIWNNQGMTFDESQFIGISP